MQRGVAQQRQLVIDEQRVEGGVVGDQQRAIKQGQQRVSDLGKWRGRREICCANLIDAYALALWARPGFTRLAHSTWWPPSRRSSATSQTRSPANGCNPVVSTSKNTSGATRNGALRLSIPVLS
jgi:hypothetical protein